MRRLSAIIILLCILAASAGAQEAKVCHLCKRVIAGSALEVDGYYYHPKHFLCDLCKQQIQGSFQRYNEGYYHPECFAKKLGLVCAICRKPLTGQYVTSNGKYYHDSCFTQKVAIKCAVCGEQIEGEYYSDSYNNAFHPRHENEYDKCFICGRLICGPITGGGQRIGDGRSICNYCYRDIVIDYGQRDRLLAKVMERLAGLGIELNQENISVLTVGLPELSQVAGNHTSPGGVRGYCKSESKSMTMGGAQVGKKEVHHTIYVLDYLPAIELEAVFAHELMHAWIFENTKGNQSLAVQEGSCNYVAWLYLQSSPESSAQFIMQRLEADPDPVYGDGFRSIKAKFSGKPVSEFLKSLKK